MIHGKDLTISVGGAVIAAAKSCDLSWECDLIEVSSPTSGNTREYIAGRSDWNISSSHLLVQNHVQNLKLIRGQRSFVRFRVGTEYFEGYAICNGFNLSGTKGQIASGSVKFKGSGPLN